MTLAAVVVLAGAYWLGTTSTTSQANAPAAPAARPAEPPSGAVATATPLAAATAWLTATNTYSWRDPSPTTWIDRTRPFLAGHLQQSTLALATSDGSGAGADWNALVTGRCSQSVTDAAGVIPPEAPATPDMVYVQVSGTVQQRCQASSPPPQQSTAATVAVTRQPDGTWRVTDQTY